MKRLLFITQKIDRNDDLLGVYHEWVADLASRFKEVTVICLYKGESELPPNVAVYSLGKEGGVPFFRKIAYLVRFYATLFSLRGRYDTVFVHMNKEYIALAGLFWKMAGMPVFFWYNHPQADWLARFAFSFSRFVFHTSPYAASAHLPHAVKMPIGIAVPSQLSLKHKRTGKIVYLGRISQVKRVGELIEAAKKISILFSLEIVGAPVDRESDRVYYKKLRSSAEPLGERIRFSPPVGNRDAGVLFEEADASVNLTDVGSMDKTIFESMAHGCPVVTSNPAVREMLPERWRAVLCVDSLDPEEIATKIEKIFALSEEEYESLRRDLFLIAQKQGISAVGEKLAALV